MEGCGSTSGLCGTMEDTNAENQKWIIGGDEDGEEAIEPLALSYVIHQRGTTSLTDKDDYDDLDYSEPAVTKQLQDPPSKTSQCTLDDAHLFHSNHMCMANHV